jgi:thiol-disulfide isomerase/thioredoxin
MQPRYELFKRILISCISIPCLLISGSTIAQSSKQNSIHYITGTVGNFNTLINKFKGKIIYIDIWASWCHPCRLELQKKKDVTDFTDFASKNEIILLYICADKNAKSWKQFIRTNDLSGYHILINDSLNNDMHRRFPYSQTKPVRLKKGFYIPRHMIIGKDGMIADSMADREGSTPVYNALNKMVSANTNH